MVYREQRPFEKETQVLSPIAGGITDKIIPYLKYVKPFPPPDSFAQVFLFLENNTDNRIEGWLNIMPPKGWVIEPGKKLMISVRQHGIIQVEFYLSIPKRPESGPHFLKIQVIEEGILLAKATFDLGAGLLFVVN